MKKVLNLQYGIGNEFFTGHVTRIGKGRYRAFLEAKDRIIRRRDLDEAEYQRLNDELHDYCRGLNPEFEFDSIWPFQDFVVDGVFPSDRSNDA